MKRVNRSNEPTVGQMIRMSHNLQALPKYDYASIYIETPTYLTGKCFAEYKIVLQPGIDGTECSINAFKSWASCQDFYFKLMENPKDANIQS